ncbi:MAG TPA: hypothetical protein VMU25_02930 [Candidatus Paceibacterota bacterium]|nr:hypothetical protein [Candidatus Paceibacterota bacterium]
MQQSATNSFFKFVLGFLVFLSVFFGVTIAVNQIAASENAQQQAAAAEALMLKHM